MVVQAPSFDATSLNYIPQVATCLADAGCDVAKWLSPFGLTEADLSDPLLTVPVATYGQLIETAVTLANDPCFGFRVAEKLSSISHGPLGLALTASKSVDQALHLIADFHALRTPLLQIEVRDGPGDQQAGLAFSMHGLGGMPRESFVGAAMLTTKQILGGLDAPQDSRPIVHFEFAEPDHAQQIRAYFDAPVAFGQQRSMLIFDKAATLLPLASHDQLTLAEAVAACKSKAKARPSTFSLSAKVEWLLQSMDVNFPALEGMAAILEISPKTLQRRLADEGTTYRLLLDDFRRRMAKEYLKGQKRSVQETAHLLGYGDTANFRRAFKRWYGAPPRQFGTSNAVSAVKPDKRNPAAFHS